MRDYINQYRLKRKIWALEYLGGKCVNCGSISHLEFDHKDRMTKITNIGRLWTASKKKFEEEVKKCQLLCQECHLEKSLKEKVFYNGEKTGHGKVWMYIKYKCRCDLCKTAKSMQARKNRSSPTGRGRVSVKHF